MSKTQVKKLIDKASFVEVQEGYVSTRMWSPGDYYKSVEVDASSPFESGERVKVVLLKMTKAAK